MTELTYILKKAQISDLKLYKMSKISFEGN